MFYILCAFTHHFRHVARPATATPIIICTHNAIAQAILVVSQLPPSQPLGACRHRPSRPNQDTQTPHHLQARISKRKCSRTHPKPTPVLLPKVILPAELVNSPKASIQYLIHKSCTVDLDCHLVDYRTKSLEKELSYSVVCCN